MTVYDDNEGINIKDLDGVVRGVVREIMNNRSYDPQKLGNNEFYIQYKNALEDFEDYRAKALPLCAAENIISEFSKKPLLYGLQERYILGGYLDYNEEDNMIGSKKLLPFYKIISEQCKKLFGAYYTDCRSLSGMNALQNILLSLTKNGDSVLILSAESGGHAALPNILKRLGVNFIEAPFNYEEFDYDYEKINKILEKNNIDFILFAPTDIIFFPKFNRMEIPSNTILVFDASQVLVFYIEDAKKNPLYLKNKVVLMGGTHKTIPGVAKALIMTNDDELAHIIDSTINPLYLRNTHIQNVASLILSLLEMEYYSLEYCEDMKRNSNYLGKKLQQSGMDVLNYQGTFSETHQLLVHMEREKRDVFYSLAVQFGISMNKKDKQLFKGSGVRLGVQEVTRYGWKYEEMDIIAEILTSLYKNEISPIPHLLNELNVKKEIQYTFKEEF